MLHLLILDSTRRRWSSSLSAGKSSSYALPIDAAITICFNSHRQSSLSQKIHRGKIDFPVLLGIWHSSLDVFHFAERNGKVKYYFISFQTRVYNRMQHIYNYRQFNEKLAPQIWYMVKCFYLLLAAYQLRQGYPTRILGNFLCKKYSIVNYVLFKGSVKCLLKSTYIILPRVLIQKISFRFMLVPFLFELRAVMDWIWTDTSMTIMDWFKMEDIFASIYQIKVRIKNIICTKHNFLFNIYVNKIYIEFFFNVGILNYMIMSFNKYIICKNYITYYFI